MFGDRLEPGSYYKLLASIESATNFYAMLLKTQASVEDDCSNIKYLYEIGLIDREFSDIKDAQRVEELAGPQVQPRDQKLVLEKSVRLRRLSSSSLGEFRIYLKPSLEEISEGSRGSIEI